MERYSVLMSIYAKEHVDYLKMSIDSILNQTIRPDQVVIVKDGPLTDALEHTIENYKKQYNDIFTIVKLEENGGLAKALNTGLQYCRNELIARMDTDDISLPERCEKQLLAFEKNNDLCMVGTQINEFVDDPKCVVSSRIVPTTFNEIKRFARRRSPFNHPTVMFKKSKILELGGYNEYGRKEDLDLFIRMVNQNYNSINLSESLLLYRISKDNLKRRKTWKNCSEYIAIMYKFYKKGYLGFNDLVYVIVGQILMYITPVFITKLLNNIFLRKKPNDNI